MRNYLLNVILSKRTLISLLKAQIDISLCCLSFSGFDFICTFLFIFFLNPLVDSYKCFLWNAYLNNLIIHLLDFKPFSTLRSYSLNSKLNSTGWNWATALSSRVLFYALLILWPSKCWLTNFSCRVPTCFHGFSMCATPQQSRQLSLLSIY